MKIIIQRNRPIAFQASTWVRWGEDMSGCEVWVDCPTCDLSFGVDTELTDKEFAMVAKNQGWVIRPGKKIVCPECQGKQTYKLGECERLVIPFEVK